jgi:hypothetical protein
VTVTLVQNGGRVQPLDGYTKPMPTRATLGFRVHSGWSAVVAVEGPPRSPSVIHRARIEIRDAAMDGSAQPYHHAAEMSLDSAGKFLARCTAASRKIAESALDEVLTAMRERDYEVVCCGILMGSGRKLPDLAATLASHALIHTAEGVFFRAAVTHACEQRGLRVSCVPEKELWTRAPALLKTTEDALRREIAELGKRIGPPWTQDEKHSALVAWMALAASAALAEPRA